MKPLPLLQLYTHRALCAVLLTMLCILSACVPDDESLKSEKQEAYRPVYLSYDEMRQIQTQTPRSLKQVGKIYVKDQYIFINEINEGIHIINNLDPSAPQNIGFISIPGNIDIAIKDQVLYADNAVDLVALDIRNLTSIKLLKRVENVFPNPKYPPYTNVRFECVDPAKGVVVRWEKTTVQDPKCYR